jgi:hypothetical protein
MDLYYSPSINKFGVNFKNKIVYAELSDGLHTPESPEWVDNYVSMGPDDGNIYYNPQQPEYLYLVQSVQPGVQISVMDWKIVKKGQTPVYRALAEWPTSMAVGYNSPSF